MSKLFTGEKMYKISVSDTATSQAIRTPTRHYKAYVEAGGSDVIIKFGDSTVVADATLTGNVFDDEGIDVLPSGTVQTLQKARIDDDYVSIVCESGGTATLWLTVADGE